jgi:prepilin-type N-terminal cleavage/methylation domain-containing protein
MKPHAVRSRIRSDIGFSLLELVMVISILGIIGVFAVPRLFSLATAAPREATKNEMIAIRRGIAGDSNLASAGTLQMRGYLIDCGAVPAALGDLVTRPGSCPAWNAFLKTGWNGPYIDANVGDYTRDAWNNLYTLDGPNRILVSNGPDGVKQTAGATCGGDDICFRF